MNLTVAAVVLLTCMTIFSATEGAILRSQLRCKCRKVIQLQEIPDEKVLKLEKYPAGPHCSTEEIIVTLKKGKLCIRPEELWVQKLVERMIK